MNGSGSRFHGSGESAALSKGCMEEIHVVSPSASPDEDRTLSAVVERLRRSLSPDSIVRTNEPLARRTTLRVGGPADVYIEPASEEDLARVLHECTGSGLPWFLLGRGSNLLIRDGGIPGIVIHLGHPSFRSITVNGTRMDCGAGARLKDIAHAARAAGLTGLEFLEGIPGSLGGALRMNAGAMGGWTFDGVESVRVMSPAGVVLDLPASEIPAEYRVCPLLRTHLALGARLKGTPADPGAIREKMEAGNRKRWESQPSQPSAGCIFKNPTPLTAGRVIDELGLKGRRRGQAMVSDVHANFIVNLGGATAADVLGLIEEVRTEVRVARGLDLHCEVEIVGRDLQ